MTVLQYEMMMVNIFIQTKMKKILLVFILTVSCLYGYGQKISNLPVVTSVVDGSLLMVRSGTSGNVLSAVTKVNFLGMFELDSMFLVGTDIVFRNGNDTLNPYTPASDRINLSVLTHLYSTPRPIVVFGVGGGNPADTLAITDSTILGSFYNGGALSIVVDTLRAIMKHGEGLDTLAFNIVWGKDFRDGPTGHLSNTQFNCGRVADVSVNLTTGNFFTTFDHNTIPPGQTVWGMLPYHPADALKRKPIYFEVTIIGHYQ